MASLEQLDLLKQLSLEIGMAADGGSDSEAGTGELADDQKIRDSCNACSAHKIRCTKEKPACRRCASKGMQCEYSVSRRNGKRRRTDAPGGISGPGVMPSAFAMEDFDHFYDMTFGAPGMSSSISDDSSMSVGTNMLPGETHDSVPVGVRHVDEAICSQQPSTEGFAAPSVFGQTQDVREDQMLLRAPGRPSRFADSNTRSRTVSALHGRGEDCTGLALGIVMRMHVASKMCTTPDPLAMHRGPQNSRSETRDIDTVLQANREAISTLNSILDCSACSRDHLCIQTCHLAAQKTVAWYAAILGIESGSHGTDLAGLVSTPPIFMGSFALGREAQRLVHASVIVTEVRDHVQPLVARLSKVPSLPLSLPSPSPTDTSTTSCGGMPDNSACNLRDQVASILARAGPLHG